MRTVVLISYHYINSKRKAGFHWLADAYKRKGWKVVFVTAPISLLSWLKNDYRFEYHIFKQANKLIQQEDNFYSYILFSLVHPPRSRGTVIDKLTALLCWVYQKINLGELAECVKKADLIIFESTAALLLYRRFKMINSNAKYVYRVSDDIRFLKLHPIVIKEEESILKSFDLVSASSMYIKNQLSKYSNNVMLHFHGINKHIYDNCTNNPYNTDTCNAIFVGNSHLDISFLEIASKQFRDVTFHIIGPFDNLPKRGNIIRYGELPFKETVPYVKYANIGLQIRSYCPGAESLTDSLKVLQYTYSKLPIVAPDFLKSPRKNMIYYKPGDIESINQAIKYAMCFDRNSIDTSDIYSWDELADMLWNLELK